MKTLISEEQIKEKVTALGRTISQDYEGKELLLIGVQKGSFIFLADLVREITVPLEIDFISAQSYDGIESGILEIFGKIPVVKGKHVIIVEDIIDTGKTLAGVIGKFKAEGAASIAVCAFLDKPSRRASLVKMDYKCFEIPDEFVIGYGMDYNEKYRNNKFIGILSTEELVRK